MDNLLKVIFFIFAALLIISGLIIFLAPKFLIRISEPLNKEFGVKRKRSKTIIFNDEKVFQNRHIFGPVLIIIGLVLLYFSFYLV